MKNIEIDEVRGFIEVDYGTMEGGMKKVLIPLQNVEKCEFIDKGDLISEKSGKKVLKL